MSKHIQVPLEMVELAIIALEKFANDTLIGRNSARELRELLEAAPQTKEQQTAECGFTELTEKVAEIELAALEEALVKREKALAKWEAKGSIGLDEELEAIHKEFHAACYAGRIQNVVYVLKAALADISRLRKAIECSRGGRE